MTIRRLWLFVLVLIAVISVSINAFVLSSLTDKYFTEYRAENYENHFNEIVTYAKSALLEENLSVKQMAIELENHLDDPITHIKLYDAQGTLLVDVLSITPPPPFTCKSINPGASMPPSSEIVVRFAGRFTVLTISLIFLSLTMTQWSFKNFSPSNTVAPRSA